MTAEEAKYGWSPEDWANIQGYKAATLGKKITDNPYKRKEQYNLFKLWKSGFQEYISTMKEFWGEKDYQEMIEKYKPKDD